MIKLIGILAALAFAAPAQAQDSEFGSFAAYLEEFRTTSNTPAMSAVILRDGEIVWEGYFGTYDDEGELPTVAETTYKIASVTKPIAATAILSEAYHGQLDLRTPMTSDAGWTELCEYFVTTQVPFMAGFEEADGAHVPPMDCDKATTLRDMLDMRANADAFVYNPIAFARIDRAISGAGGRELRDIVRDRIARVAGMHDVALGWRDPDGGASLRYLAEPFDVVDGRLTKQPLPDDDFRAAAGMIASPRAIAAFDIAFDEGRFWPAGMRREDPLQQPVGPLGDYRQGWFHEDFNGTRLMWHSGWNPQQYSALYLKVPEKRLSLIILANTDAIWWGNSFVRAHVVDSPIAKKFLDTFAR